MSAESSYPGLENYGGWTVSESVPGGVVHYFPSPYANSACSKLGPKERQLAWMTPERLVERRFCATCVRVSQSWDLPPKIYSPETAAVRVAERRATRAEDIRDAFTRARTHAFQVLDDYGHALELMIEDGQPQHEIDAVTRELHTFIVLATLPAPREISWGNIAPYRHTQEKS